MQQIPAPILFVLLIGGLLVSQQAHGRYLPTRSDSASNELDVIKNLICSFINEAPFDKLYSKKFRDACMERRFLSDNNMLRAIQELEQSKRIALKRQKSLADATEVGTESSNSRRESDESFVGLVSDEQ